MAAQQDPNSIIHAQIAQYSAGNLSVHVDEDRFTATSASTTVELKDFVVKIFRDFLPHTPVHSLGINRDAHFKLPSPEKRMAMGRAFAPTEPWGAWGREIASTSAPSGMMSLQMRKMREGDDVPPGYMQVMIQPSTRIPRNVGIYFQVNDHYEIRVKGDVQGSSEIMDILDAYFEKSTTAGRADC